MQQLIAGQNSPEVPVNENFEALSAFACFAKKQPTTTGLTWGYYGGRWAGFLVADGTLTLTASSTNYVVVANGSGAISVSTSATNWNDTTNYSRVYKITTGAAAVTAVEDHRFGAGGVGGGTGGTPGSGAELRGLTLTSDTTAQADADPGPGKFRWNNATQASATMLFLDDQTADGVSLATFYSSLPGAGFLYLQQADDATKWQLWKLTAAPVNAGGYRKFAVALQASAGAIATAKTVLMSFTQTFPLTADTDVALAANSDTVVATQKAVKSYVDAKINGLSWKQQVRAATVAAGTLATSFANGQTIDGVTLATGDRILVKNQSTGSENGIYVVAASGAPTRSLDATIGANLVDASMYVAEGTTLADTQWVCTTNAPITVGSTALAFAQLTSGGGGSGFAGVNVQTGTSYTVQASDNNKLIVLNNAAAVAVTLPQATGSFASPFTCEFMNIGAGQVTVTTTTSLIQPHGGSAALLPSGAGLALASNSTDWYSNRGSFLGGKLQRLLKYRDPVLYNTVSSGTMDVGLAGSNLITCNLSSGSIDFLGPSAGVGAVVTIQFTLGGVSLTHNASTLILPNNGSNITTALNDVGTFMCLGITGASTWACIAYVKADGKPLQSAGLVYFEEKFWNVGVGYQSQLIPKTALAGDAAIILTPKGNEAILADIPTGNYQGGNQRGQYAFDFQRFRTAGADIAGAARSALTNGDSNAITSAGVNGLGLGGQFNLIDAADSTARGQYASTLGMTASHARGLAGPVTTRGYINAREFMLTGLTTGAQTKTCTVDGSTAAYANQLGLNVNGAISVRGQAIWQDINTNGEMARQSFECGGSNLGGTFALKGTPVIGTLTGDATMLTALGSGLSITADNTNKTFAFAFTNSVSSSRQFRCVIEGVAVNTRY